MITEETAKITNSRSTILDLKNISKAFPGVQALADVSVEIKKGEILAILGENGAGKSTLMKILSGLYQPDSGQIHVNFDWFQNTATEYENLTPTTLPNPREAMKIGIGMVYQHFQLVEPFTVADNIVLGKEYTKRNVWLDDDLAHSEVRSISEQYGLPIDPQAIVEELPVGLRQRVEIIKQLFRDAELLILDEPTAVLTPTEVDELFKTMRSLKKAGKAQIFISHKLKEPLEIADRIIVMRKGRLVGEITPDKANEEILAEMVVGRKILQQLDRQKFDKEQLVLNVNNLSVYDPKIDDYSVKEVSFEIQKHQIVGVAGVQGNGQTELVEAIIGLKKTETGYIAIHEDGEEIELSNQSVLKRLRHGIGYIPEDRGIQGLILEFIISENVWLAFHDVSYREELDESIVIPDEEVSDEKEISTLRRYYTEIKRRMILPFTIIENVSRTIIQKFDVAAVSINSITRDLSGGNQQKLLLGREFAKNPRLIIASQPTRGVDIGVMERVHEELIKKRNQGTGILLVSSDLEEVLKLSDVIMVMYEGRVVGMDKIENMPLAKISHLMTTGRATSENGDKKV
ncbi:MAG: ABC transporter ATP-binding protein [Candidatus Kariarchaeaceae archaeon]